MEYSQNSWRILVVDDEPEIHAVLGKFLSNQGYTVDSAYSAEDAYKMITKKRPDLVILDIMMPKVSGMDVCNRIKSSPATRDILVLIVSARDAQSDRIEGLKKGADDYVSKPFHLKSLVRKIGHMLEKKQIGDFEREITIK